MLGLYRNWIKEYLNVLVVCTTLAAWIRLTIGNVRPVSRCPTCKAAWTHRALNMSCDKKQGLYYHCIMDTDYNLVELCLVRRPISPGKEGCPLIYRSGNIIVHEGENSPCPISNPFCPASSKTYYTNELYRYPICFHNISERVNYIGEHCDNIGLTSVEHCEKQNTSKTTLDCTHSPSTSLTLTFLFVVSVVANFALSILLYCTCKRNKTNSGLSSKFVSESGKITTTD